MYHINNEVYSGYKYTHTHIFPPMTNYSQGRIFLLCNSANCIPLRYGKVENEKIFFDKTKVKKSLAGKSLFKSYFVLLTKIKDRESCLHKRHGEK